MIYNYSTWNDLFELQRNEIDCSLILEDIDYNLRLTEEQKKAAKDKVTKAIGKMSQGILYTKDNDYVKKDDKAVDHLNLRFTHAFLRDCRIIWDYPGFRTMATDGINLYINTRFVHQLNMRLIIAILCHEVFHVTLLHTERMTRIVGENPTKALTTRFNKAADYEINPILVDEGLITIEELKELKACYDEAYIGKSVNKIYPLIPIENTPKKKNKAKLDDYITIKKDGSLAKITKVNDDGSYECELVPADQVEAIKKAYRKAGKSL